jgi:hypothetical protein
MSDIPRHECTAVAHNIHCVEIQHSAEPRLRRQLLRITPMWPSITMRNSLDPSNVGNQVLYEHKRHSWHRIGITLYRRNMSTIACTHTAQYSTEMNG